MSTPTIPDALLPLLTSKAVAFVSTIGPHGEPQTTPLWFLWRDDAVQISLVEGRQKLRNLRRDPRISVVIVDPAEPTRYLELRGHIDALTPDPDRSLERDVAVKYVGKDVDIEPPGTMRYVTRIVVERITKQDGI
ncbi:MAG: PPOX class F420-dependent oxidoreductase [Thermomicrobiales bacterium]